MALFKILRGNSSSLPSTRKDGYAYFCTDTHDFYIDYKTQETSDEIFRTKLSVEYADKLRYKDDNDEWIEINPKEQLTTVYMKTWTMQDVIDSTV